MRDCENRGYYLVRIRLHVYHQVFLINTLLISYKLWILDKSKVYCNDLNVVKIIE